jgi:protein-L-isoaspartate O-methyltransferase
MTGSLAYRKNEAAILRGDVPPKYLRIMPHITGHSIVEVGSAEGVLALLLARQGKEVTAIEKSPERHEAAQALADTWGVSGVRFVNGDILSHLDLLPGHDTLVCVRSVYYLGPALDTLFKAAGQTIPNIVLCGNKNRAARWRAGAPDEPLGEMNRYAASEGMTDLLLTHGYKIKKVITEGDEIVVGCLG